MLSPPTFIAKLMSKRHSNASISLLDQGFVSAVNFLTVVILARYLSLEMFGVFMIAQTILTLLTGLQNTLVALPHNILGPQRQGLAYARLTIVLGLLQLMLSLGLATIVAIGGVLLRLNGHADSAHLAFALALTVLPWMGQEFVRRVLYTQRDVASAAVNNIVCYGLQLAGIAIVVMQIGGTRADPSNAMFALGISSSIATALGLWQLRHQVAVTKIFATELRSIHDFKIATLETWQVSRWPMAQQVVAWFGASGHGWILAFFLGPAGFGIYRAAYQVVNILNPFRQTAINHLPSRAAHVYATGGARHLAAWTKQITLALTIPFAIGALVISLAAEPLAALMYGAHTQLSNLQLIVGLGALSYTINFLRTPLDYAVLIGGDGRALFLRSLLLMALVLTGGVFLIWSLGIYGAMLSEAASATIALFLTMKIYSTARRNARHNEVEVTAAPMYESASPYGIASEPPQSMSAFPRGQRHAIMSRQYNQSAPTFADYPVTRHNEFDSRNVDVPENPVSLDAVSPDKVYMYLKHFPAAGVPLRVGTNKAVHGLASGLVASGIAVDVWCEGDRDGRAVMPEGYGVQCFATRSRYRTFRLAPSLQVQLTTLRPKRDLVVLNGMFHPSVYALSRQLKALGIPYIVAPHGPYHPFLFRKNPHLKWPYWYFLERTALKSALALQQLDLRHGAWARRLGISVPIVATENGFSNKDQIEDSELSWRAEGIVRVLYWGRMAVHTKGLDILLQGFDLAVRDQPMRLTLQGPDWAGESADVQRLIAGISAASSVTTLPPVFEIPAARVMLSHDIFCMPSRFEGFGLSALEAMLAARVLIVSRSAGIAPHIEKSGCGIVVDPTAADVQRGFRYLLERRSRWREMGLRGREYAQENLHWNRIAKRTLTQYRQLLN